MAQPTLDEMLQFCASETNTSEDVVKNNNIYTGDALPIVTKFINAINYAKNMIIRQKYIPTFIQQFTLDSNKSVDLSSCSKIFVKLIEVRDENLNIINTYRISQALMMVFDYMNPGDKVNIEYGYKPADFSISSLTQILDLPEGIIDWQILCYYACYKYHLIKGGDRDLDKTTFFLGLYNDGFSNIKNNFNSRKTIKSVYGVD